MNPLSKHLKRKLRSWGAPWGALRRLLGRNLSAPLVALHFTSQRLHSRTTRFPSSLLARGGRPEASKEPFYVGGYFEAILNQFLNHVEAICAARSLIALAAIPSQMLRVGWCSAYNFMTS